MNNGYIKLWRKSLDSDVFADPHLWRLWSWCLMKASYKQRTFPLKTGKGRVLVKLTPGQFVFGRDSAADDLGDPPSSVWKRMKRLENLGNITIRSNSQYSIISICNYDAYQSSEALVEQLDDDQNNLLSPCNEIKDQVGERVGEQAWNNQGTAKEHKQEGKEGKYEINTAPGDEGQSLTGQTYRS